MVDRPNGNIAYGDLGETTNPELIEIFERNKNSLNNKIAYKDLGETANPELIEIFERKRH